MNNPTSQLYKTAFGLAIFTIIYNLIEGSVATFIGFTDESLTLFGFGIDSFIETVSGFGILRMVTRIQLNPNSNRDQYERAALKITGFSFYALVLGLLATCIYNIYTKHTPETTFFGVIIALVSILIMLALVYWKTRVGKALHSDAIIADADCTKVCIYMSVVLLISSALYEWIRWPYFDSIGALVLAYLAFKEGRECFEKATSDKLCGCEHE